MDSAKVIKGLEEVQHYIKVENLPAHTLWAKLVIDDALALLKAREPKLVTNIHKEHNNVLNPNVPWVGKCPKCGKKIEGRNLTRFCKFCGQAVKWE